MDDEEDPLDKYLVSNLLLPPNPLSVLEPHFGDNEIISLSLFKMTTFSTRFVEGEPSTPAGQPPPGAGERQPRPQADQQQGRSEERSGQGWLLLFTKRFI